MKRLTIGVALLLVACQNAPDDHGVHESSLTHHEELVEAAYVKSSDLDTLTMGAVQVYRVNYEIWGGSADVTGTYRVNVSIGNETVADSVSQHLKPGAVWRGSIILSDAPVSLGPATYQERLTVTPTGDE